MRVIQGCGNTAVDSRIIASGSVGTAMARMKRKNQIALGGGSSSRRRRQDLSGFFRVIRVIALLTAGGAMISDAMMPDQAGGDLAVVSAPVVPLQKTSTCFAEMGWSCER